MVKRDTFGQMLENMVNSRPSEGGVSRKAVYHPSEGRIYVDKQQENRNAILRENYRLYLENGGLNRKNRKDFAGGYPLRIPEQDYAELVKAPEIQTGDKDTIKKFWIKVYERHPEYRIG